jgi:hypothetical protein
MFKKNRVILLSFLIYINIIFGIDVVGLGFEGNYDPVDPISCEGITSFDNTAEYLREQYVSTTSEFVAAANSALPGDKIILEPGEYVGSIKIKDVKGTKKNPIMIIGAENHQSIIKDAGTFHLSNSSYIIINQIKIENKFANGINIDDAGTIIYPSKDIILDNLIISNVYKNNNGIYPNCIKMAGVDDFIIKNSDLSDCSSTGIDLVGCHNGIIINNYIYDVGHGAQIKGGSSNVTVHGNLFENINSRGVNMGGGTGSQFFRPALTGTNDYEALHLRTTSNIFLNPLDGISYTGCFECLVANNLFYKPTTRIIRILRGSQFSGIILAGNSEYVNNIIVFDNSIVTRTNVDMDSTKVDEETFRFANNLWYPTGSFDYDSYKGYVPTIEINPIKDLDPLFVDVSNKNFHLQSQSPAIGSGEPGLVNTDFDGNCFGNDNNIGPYTGSDYINRPDTPTGLGVISIEDTEISFGWDSVSNIDGYKIYRDGLFVAEITSTQYSDEGLEKDTNYSYQITSIKDDIESIKSSSIIFSTTNCILITELDSSIDDWLLGVISIIELFEKINQYKSC